MADETGPVPHQQLVRCRSGPPPRSEIRRARTHGDRGLVGAMTVALALTTASCATSAGTAAPTSDEQRAASSDLTDDTPGRQAPEPSADQITAGADSQAASPSDVDPDLSPTSVSATPTTTTVAPKTVLSPNPIVPTTVPLPQPIAPPSDDGASEPVIELGSLAIAAIGLDATLYEGIRLPTFDLGPGHWPGSAMPGQIGNMVIGGHRTVGNADFRHLDQLRPGDEMIVTDSGGARHTYVVDSSEITDPFAARMIHQTSERTATLFACHPPGSVTHRIVVHLTLLE